MAFAWLHRDAFSGKWKLRFSVDLTLNGKLAVIADNIRADGAARRLLVITIWRSSLHCCSKQLERFQVAQLSFLLFVQTPPWIIRVESNFIQLN